jgi:ATP-dependent helicase/nuclease subunit A
MTFQSRAIPEALRAVQVKTSNPDISAWVAANAGSGKTHVLAQRVIRLLLAGVEPAKILCITFTKAAAANMTNRVFDALRRWTALDDAELHTELRKITDGAPDQRLLARGRTLFAEALETPGGLKVETIHAFCARLLRQFPFEANVPGRFEVLDEAGQAQLLRDVSLAVLLEGAKAPEGPIGSALATAMAFAADRTFMEVLSDAVRKRDMIRACIDHDGGVAGVIAALCGTLGINGRETMADVEREMTEGPLLPSLDWQGAIDTLMRGKSNDTERATSLLSALNACGSARVDFYLQVFFKKTDMAPRERITTADMQREHPALCDRLKRERDRLVPLLEKRRAVWCRDRTAALITVADAVISRYEAEKNRRALLDYDDLIDRARALLGENRAAWVHYKLDQGIDHVLIDEAQDTSVKQWEIVQRLTDEFFAGAGARTAHRTVFAVGDEKQSIFSFQQAAPRAFAQSNVHFERAHKASGREFVREEFKYSFRSGANLLEGVDAVFKPADVCRSVTSEEHIPPHLALPEAPPGSIEMWDLLHPEESKREDHEAWDAPFDEQSEKSSQVMLAAKIAKKVTAWIASARRAGDVLVLVRQRGPLFEAIIRALKDAHVAVAGADRLVLTEHIAVMDLLALADALLLPDDDLALATVLKSPLFGWSENELFDIAWQRKSSLRSALRERASLDARCAEAARALDLMAEEAHQELPFAFYARVLGAQRGRKKFLTRLGPEADDPLDEFLALALDYERRETPSLQGFVAWLRTVQTEVKRDMEIARDLVRVMTVHGAKGLEAPIVVLADTTTPPAGPPHRQPRLFGLPRNGGADPPHLIWAGIKLTDAACVAEARRRVQQEAEHEYRRLLYVGMTRAAEQLIVCGAQGKQRLPDGCWWTLVTNALVPLSMEETDEDGSKLWRFSPKPPTRIDASSPSPQAIADAEQPVWLNQPVRAPSILPRPIIPSRSPPLIPAQAGIQRSLGPRFGGDERKKALARGTLMHRLLQSLPDIPLGARRDAAREYFSRRAREFTREECESMAEQACGLLEKAEFSELFGKTSRAEVPIVGRLQMAGRLIPVSGQVDRLAVFGDAVLIGDYKTDRPAPHVLDDVPAAYIRQLALYRAVLRQLYPDKHVRAALLWTDVPDLMEIPASVLDTTMAREGHP